MIKSMASALCALFVACGSAHAANVQDLGKFSNWSATAYDESGARKCFLFASPVSEEPAQLNHGDVFFFVQTDNSPGDKTESSFQTGYDFAKDSTVRVTIGDETFQMFTSGRSAWLRRVEREGELLAAMRSGSSMVLAATSARGNDTSYTFSLNGVTAGSRLLARCGDGDA